MKFFTVRMSAMCLVIAVCFIASAKVHALGVGTAVVDSYIGEKLSIRIPLYDVVDPNGLSIDFSSSQFGREGQSEVQAVLDRTNSQLALELSSNSVITEPYLDFNLKLVDGNAAFNKDFTVLLNLAPRNQASQLAASATGFTVDDLPNSANEESGRSVARGDLMGPYEYAEAGNIPSRFGAVLDGQSLWRVARRINGAMGVSRSQMMWALYEANPNAFAARNVQSLQAGTFLTIPDESVVKRVSHEQAKANLSALSAGSDTSASVDVAVEGSSVTESSSALAEFSDVENSAKPESGTYSTQNNSFQVASVSELSDKLGGEDSQQAQEIIASLTETVGSLSQQLMRKDGRIELLEAQVAELKSFISSAPELVADDATNQMLSETPNNALVTDLDTTSSIESEGSAADQQEVESYLGEEAESYAQLNSEEALGIQGSEIDETLATLDQAPASPQEVVTSIADTVEPETVSADAKPVWFWFAIGLAAFLIVALLLWRRVVELWRSLFGSNERVEFNDPSVLEMPKVYSREKAAFDSAPEQPFDPSAKVEQDTDRRDYSKLVSVDNTEGEGSLPGISTDEFDDDGSFEPNDIIEFELDEADESVTDEADLSFDERFNSLLNDNDFEFARELLDFARYNEINDERYHFERLRLLEKMSDEDGFYEYYYEIEDKIPSFPQAVQTEISQLVVQLAHT